MPFIFERLDKRDERGPRVDPIGHERYATRHGEYDKPPTEVPFSTEDPSQQFHPDLERAMLDSLIEVGTVETPAGVPGRGVGALPGG